MLLVIFLESSLSWTTLWRQELGLSTSHHSLLLLRLLLLALIFLIIDKWTQHLDPWRIGRPWLCHSRRGTRRWSLTSSPTTPQTSTSGSRSPWPWKKPSLTSTSGTQQIWLAVLPMTGLLEMEDQPGAGMLTEEPGISISLEPTSQILTWRTPRWWRSLRRFSSSGSAPESMDLLSMMSL